MKKKEFSLGFSYLDVFFLLLAVLFLSFFVYFAAEKGGVETPREVEITVRAVYEESLFHAIPPEGATLFDSEGEPLGRVLRVRRGEGEKKQEVELDLAVPDLGFAPGESFTVDTPNSVKEGVILRIKSEQNERGEGA